MDPRALRVITYTAVLFLAASAVLLLIPATHRAAQWLLAEDGPVEYLTVIAFLSASVMAARLASMHRHEFRWVSGVYLVIAIGFLLIAMEEVSWGQRVLNYETPEAIRRINGQCEVTLHNLGVMQGHTEWMRVLAGVAGLLAVAAHRIAWLVRLAAPAVLQPWFLIIVCHALLDAVNDIVPLEPRFDVIMMRTSEVIELLIAVAAFLYGWLNVRRFEHAARNAEALV
jgi:hypothetical protein